MIDLRPGRWQDVLGDVECDALICDPPYSERTHAGYRSGALSNGKLIGDPGLIKYAPLTQDDAAAMVAAWTPRVRRWFVVFGDHVSQAWFSDALQAAGWYTFAPLGWVNQCAPPRLGGDGPQCSMQWIVVARPRHVDRIGSPPGHYLVTRVEGAGNGSAMPGQKPLRSMRQLVRDYTRPGDLVCDPCAGMATTLLAAAMEGRRAVGAEERPDTFAAAEARIARGWQAPLLELRSTTPVEQPGLLWREAANG